MLKTKKVFSFSGIEYFECGMASYTREPFEICYFLVVFSMQKRTFQNSPPKQKLKTFLVFSFFHTQENLRHWTTKTQDIFSFIHSHFNIFSLQPRKKSSKMIRPATCLKPHTETKFKPPKPRVIMNTKNQTHQNQE